MISHSSLESLFFIFLVPKSTYIGTQKLLCGNVKKFPIAKNGYAHRVQHTRISLGVNFCTSSSLIFEDFWVWKLKRRVLCTARYVHCVSANHKNDFLSESSSQNLEVVVFKRPLMLNSTGNDVIQNCSSF